MRLLPFRLLLVLALGLSIILIYILGIPEFDLNLRLSDQDFEALQSLCSGSAVWWGANGLGFQAEFGGDDCQVTLKFPDDTVSNWSDPKTGKLDGLLHEFDLCDTVATWEQARNSTTVLTREYIDALPNGWTNYAWGRINKGIRCKYSCHNPNE